MEGAGKTGPGSPSDILAAFPQADSLVFSIARTTDELVRAYKLVYSNYLRSGYIDPHPSEMRYSAHNALPQTVTLVAKLGEKIVTTASVVCDSPLGLPMDSIYREDLDGLRAGGARLCEVTMLADRRRIGIRTIPSLLHLFRLILHYAQSHSQTTDIVITINPSHEAFYTRYLLFDNLAGLKSYPSVKNAPALAKRVNLAALSDQTRWPRLFDFFMRFDAGSMDFDSRKRFTEDELRDFFVVRRSILPNLPGPALAYLRSQYPQFNFDRVLAPVAT